MATSHDSNEPVAWMFDWDVYDPTNLGPDFSQTKPNDGKTWTPLYTHPPREWRSLSEEEVWSQYQTLWPFHPAEEPRLAADISKFARAIEQALRSKNQ